MPTPPAHNHNGTYNPRTRERGLDCHQEEEMGEEEDAEHTEKEDINLGSFRMEAEILSELHLKYPWVKVVRRITRTGNALLAPKDDRSRKLLTEVKDLKGKQCSFRPMDTMFRKTYILMEVPSCITEELLLQDDMVLEAYR